MTLYLYKINDNSKKTIIENVANYTINSITTNDGIVYSPLADDVELSSKEDCSETLRKDLIEKTKILDQIASLKTELSSTDYKIIKCSEAQLVGEKLPYDIASLHAERQALRDKINELEQQLEANGEGGAI